MLEKMKKFVREMDLCVMATASEGKPHCSLMVYVVDDDCQEIYMTTLRHTTKFRNLMENPMVSLLIDNRVDHSGSLRSETKAMTVAGRYSSLENSDKISLIREKLLARHPHLAKFLGHPDAEVLRIRISSFLLLNGLAEADFEEIPAQR
jgi:nitroimidazol reductase NimA-like FMN-containing flavoprotein (pyridoxamine 5'-phosphate oxidase superfamily)